MKRLYVLAGMTFAAALCGSAAPEGRAWSAPLVTPAQSQFVLQEGHRGDVEKMTLSADGTILVSGDSKGVIKVWDAQRGRLLRTLTGHDSRVTALALSSDGHLVSSSDDGTLKFWNVKTGRLFGTMRERSDAYYQLALSSDGKTLAAANGNGVLTVWRLPGTRLIQTFAMNPRPVDCMALSADGKTLVTGGYENTVRVWNVPHGKLLRTWRGKTDSNSISGVALSPNGKRVVSAHEDGALKIWELSSGRLLGTLIKASPLELSSPEEVMSFRQGLTNVSLSKDGRTLAISNRDNTVQIWNLTTRRRLRTLRVANNGTVAVSADGKTVAGAGEDKAIRVYGSRNGHLQSTLVAGAAPLDKVAWSSDGKRLVFDTREGEVEASDGSDEFARLSGGTLKVWSVPERRTVHSIFHRGYFLYEADAHTHVLSDNGKTLVVGAEQGALQVWDAASGRLIRTVNGNPKANPKEYPSINDCAVSADGTTIAARDGDAHVKVWDAPSGRLLQLFKDQYVSIMVLNRDGKILVTSRKDRQGKSRNLVRKIKIWNVTTGSLIHAYTLSPTFTSGRGGSPTGLGIPTYDVLLIADGKLFVSGYEDNGIKIYEANSGRLIRTLKGHTDRIKNIVLSADSKTLFSSSEDGTVRQWDVATGRLLHTLANLPSAMTSVSLSPDGKTVMTTSENGAAQFWKPGTAQPLRLTMYVFGRDFVMFDTKGRFDGTRAGLEQLHLVQGSKLVPLNPSHNPRYTPGLLEKTFSS